jgi:hypothetical protein
MLRVLVEGVSSSRNVSKPTPAKRMEAALQEVSLEERSLEQDDGDETK